ncbi:hypothetical protein CR513_59515, partial [Mucuna pruriens]
MTEGKYVYKFYNLEAKKSSKFQKGKMVILDNYKKNERQVDPTFDESESSNRPQRLHQLSSRLKDFVVGNDSDPFDEEIINFSLFANCESMTFQKASCHENWRNSMSGEVHAIEKNKT